MKVAHIDAFRSDPVAFWEFYRPRLSGLGGVEPNRAHEVLAELERRGLLEGVITQNIDTLHTKAGSERVVEVHGSIRTASCQACEATYELAKVEELFDTKASPPVVPAPAWSSRTSCCSASSCPPTRCSRPRRWPPGPTCCSASAPRSRSIPWPACRRSRWRRGGKLAIVTQGPTPYDGDAQVRMDGDVVADLDAVLAAL